MGQAGSMPGNSQLVGRRVHQQQRNSSNSFGPQQSLSIVPSLAPADPQHVALSPEPHKTAKSVR
jgi:hypothetical protein